MSSVKMNNKGKLFSIIFVIIAAMPFVTAQLISELNINKNEFAVNERLIVVATIENVGSSSVYLQSHIYNSRFNTQLNTKSIEIPAQETKKIILYNFILDDTYREGDYSIIIKVVDASDNTIDSKTVSFSITGSIQDFYFSIFACKDQSCAEISEIFTQEDIIYLNFDSGVSNPTIIASLEYPDKSKEQISMPTFMPASQTGSYSLEATAFKQGYKTMTQLIHFNVIEKTIPGLCNNDGACNNNENYQHCPQECPSGSGDGFCDGIYDTKCDPDCLTDQDPDCLFRKPNPEEEKPNYIIPIGISLIILISFILAMIISRKVQQ